MKKIVIIGMIKNSADIIESFIRCNAVLADYFVLLDNMSTDRTRVILDNLIDEGFKIEVLDDTENAYCQSEKMNKLMRYVLEKYNPDYIIPLDDDEIIISEMDDKGVREILELLPENYLYYAQWKNYIPTEEDEFSTKSVPQRMRFRIDDQIIADSKIIIPVKVIDDSFVIAQGNHYGEGCGIANHVTIKELRIAHFPIRSEEQIKSKALIGWTNYLLVHNREKNHGMHWKEFYDLIKKGEKLPVDRLQTMVLNYYAEWDVDRVNVIFDPLRLPNKCFELKYTSSDEINFMKNYMEHVEKIINENMLGKQCEKE